MLISAEVRWFWKDTSANGIEQWFCGSEAHPFPAGGGKARTDLYLQDAEQVELGIKQRAETAVLEIKGLVILAPETVTFGLLSGPIEIWGKWNSNSLKLDASSTTAIQKRRWLRKFDTSSPSPVEIALDAGEHPINNLALPKEGCNVELTRLHLPDREGWWTLGFEAFGAIESVRDNLRSAARIMSYRQPPEVHDAIVASYPKWLGDCLVGSDIPS